jgi:hypothetical protein
MFVKLLLLLCFLAGLGNDNMSLECSEVRELIKELDFVIDPSRLVDTDTPFLCASPSSITNKHSTVDDLLGRVSAGILSLLSSSSTHVHIFGLDEAVRGSREVKGNVPLLHHSVVELFDILTSVVHLIDNENNDSDDEE